MTNAKVEKAARALLAMQRHSWEQGVAMHAFLEMGDMETVTAMAFESVNRSLEDGRAAVIGFTEAVTDHCSIGEGLIKACELTESNFLCEGRQKLLHWALEGAPRNEDGIIYHLNSTEEFWSDSFYMCPPYFAAEGLFDEALEQWNGYWDKLFDEDARLICHKWDNSTKSYSRIEHWGTGNGWTLASIPRMLEHLPQDKYAKERKELMEKGGLLLDSLISYMTPEGYFHDVVDDPKTFLETNLSQMTAYFIYQGIYHGWLADSYKPYADKMRQAANAKMNELGFIADVCGAPSFDKSGYSPEGQAFYIMMEAAADRKPVSDVKQNGTGYRHYAVCQ